MSGESPTIHVIPETFDDSRIYDDVEIEDMEFDEDQQAYFYPCPCGDRFFITLEDLIEGENIATCPSCSLRIRVVYNAADFEGLLEEYSDEEASATVEA